MRKRQIGFILWGLFFIVGNIFVLPWLLRLPGYVLENPLRAANLWLAAIEDSPLAATRMLLDDPEFRRLWLYTQPLLLAAFFWVLWQPGLGKKRNRVGDGVGGPEAAGYSTTHGSSRWQERKEINKNTSVWNTKRNPEKGGVILGYEQKTGRAWLETRDFHTLLIGTTRSGKTRRIIFPTIWHLAQAEESMIVTDPKGELYERSRDYLEEKGYQVTLIDFRNPRRGNSWNPLDPVVQSVKASDLSRASERAWDIAHMIVHQKPHTGDPLWPNGEESVIAALILASCMEAPEEKYKHMGSCYAMLSGMGGTDEKGNVPLSDYLQQLPAGHLAQAAYGTALLAPEKARGSFFTGAAADLRLWADPGIIHLTCKQGHCLESAGREKTAVFLVIPDEKSTRHMLASLYIDQAYQALVDLAIKNRGCLPRRVNFLLDEFGNLPVITDFDKKLTVAGGRNMRFV
ncbi:type IV secretory system conjugative DNA transfer family protein, partial [candidate division NPL-UPA2 bacterium]|nr:type IV secretory system conjugative DNA transfer family protein [candidate division NPL-UPA2 bacterium]